MKKINNELKNIINSLHGNILMIGNYDDKITDIINQNNNIVFCDVLSKEESNSKMIESEQGKKLNIKKLKKYYKKKKLDYLIVEEDKVEDYKNTFVKDSIYITNKKIYVIPSNENVTLRMYKRYSKKIEVIDCLDGKIICIDVVKVKSNKIKDFWYGLIESILDAIDFIGNILIN